MEDSKFWIQLWALLVGAILIVVAECFIYNYYMEKTAMENGYQKVLQPVQYESFYKKVIE